MGHILHNYPVIAFDCLLLDCKSIPTVLALLDIRRGALCAAVNLLPTDSGRACISIALGVGLGHRLFYVLLDLRLAIFLPPW
ncbi:hypothetical protein CDAR_579831 [Caerostris darwini]|uniref:Uncharacterized protein n=1 Tax=Caerostris darwini TaxID=1538125 RepID=A0AAV4PTR0_9ARAC|nr:hypothetical protein CDAR_579831 [Caerostris darwini]